MVTGMYVGLMVGQDHEYEVLEQSLTHQGDVGTEAGFRNSLHGSRTPNHFVNCSETEKRESLNSAGIGR